MELTQRTFFTPLQILSSERPFKKKNRRLPPPPAPALVGGLRPCRRRSGCGVGQEAARWGEWRALVFRLGCGFFGVVLRGWDVEKMAAWFEIA